MAVAMVLDRSGFDEEVVVAGLLHDLVEDTGITLDEIRSAFGNLVAETVAGCSEIKLDASGAKRPWADRKRDHLEALKSATMATKAVTLADKLHNLASIAFDLDDGRPVWSTFNAPRGDVLAYYRAMIATCGTGDHRLEALARQAVAALDQVESHAEISVENPTPPGLLS
jgi:(p)ppGpp synthase/HD superfamily hydrolase